MSRYDNLRQITSRPPFELVLLAIGVILVMYRSNRILYVRYVPETICYGAAFICFAFYAALNYRRLNRVDLFGGISLLLYSLVMIYDKVRLGSPKLISMLPFAVGLIGGYVLLQAPAKHKALVIRYFTITTQVIIGVALVGWILYLLGFPLPSFTDNSDNFYFHTVFYVFNLNGAPGQDLFPRFAGPFLEPGHCGTMAIFLLYIDRFRMKNIGNIVLLVAVLLSFSLAAYGLLIMAVALVLLQNRQFLALAASLGIFLAAGVVAMDFNNGFNAINERIVSRLEVGENGEISGNNRTSSFFDLSYGKYVKSDRVWLGVGRAAFGSSSDGSDNVTIGSAGYKRYFYLRGIIGSLISGVFLFYYTGGYWNKKTCGFLLVYIIANLIRDYITMEMWMYLFLMAMPVIYYNLNVKSDSKLKSQRPLHGI